MYRNSNVIKNVQLIAWGGKPVKKGYYSTLLSDKIFMNLFPGQYLIKIKTYGENVDDNNYLVKGYGLSTDQMKQSVN